MLYRDVLESANLRKISLVSATAMLAIWLLTLGQTTTMAEAEDFRQFNGKIAFYRDYAVYTVEPDSSNLNQLTDDTYAVDRPVWSPDGAKIAFSHMREGSSFPGISVMNADGSNLRDLRTIRISGSPAPTWLPDGTKLAFSGREAPPPASSKDIYMMDPDGSNLTNLTKTPSYSELEPAFSPDGSQMCLFRDSDIYVMDADGSDPTLLEAIS
jgi:Tol biopolymer transport system component